MAPRRRKPPRGPSIGAPGFEPGTSCSQSRRATGLRYAPKISSYQTVMPCCTRPCFSGRLTGGIGDTGFPRRFLRELALTLRAPKMGHGPARSARPEPEEGTYVRLRRLSGASRGRHHQDPGGGPQGNRRVSGRRPGWPEGFGTNPLAIARRRSSDPEWSRSARTRAIP
jgi:hypothetical protein